MSVENKPSKPGNLKVIKGTSFIGAYSGCMLTEADIERLQRDKPDTSTNPSVKTEKLEKNLVVTIWEKYPMGFYSAVKDYLNDKMDQNKK